MEAGARQVGEQAVGELCLRDAPAPGVGAQTGRDANRHHLLNPVTGGLDGRPQPPQSVPLHRGRRFELRLHDHRRLPRIPHHDVRTLRRLPHQHIRRLGRHQLPVPTRMPSDQLLSQQSIESHLFGPRHWPIG